MDIYQNLSYSHGKVATTLLTALAAPAEEQTLADIGEVYRFCLAETILIKKPFNVTLVPSPAPAADATEVTMSDGTVAAPSGEADAAVAKATTPTVGPNQKAVLDVISQIPTNIVPLLQGGWLLNWRSFEGLLIFSPQPSSSSSCTAEAPTRATARRPRPSPSRSRPL